MNAARQPQHDVTAIFVCALLAACSTSLYASLFAVLMLVLMLLAQRGAGALATSASVRDLWPALSVIVAGGVATYVLARVSANVQAGFTHIVAFACVAACVPIGTNVFTRTLAQRLVLLPAAALLVELLAWGTVPGDREIAFDGALRVLELRITDTRLLPWLAAPAGAVLVLGLLLALFARSPATDQPAVISAPRPGRRVRVTGQIR